MSTRIECCREQDVLDALASARWPDRCDELRAHVTACPLCADLIEVTGPLLALRDQAFSVRVPSPGTVWWRAQLRARREAARQASRPIGIAQGIAGTCAVLLALGACWAASPWIAAASHWLASWLATATALTAVDLPRIGLPDTTTLAKAWWAAALLGLWIVLGPLAVYLALEE